MRARARQVWALTAPVGASLAGRAPHTEGTTAVDATLPDYLDMQRRILVALPQAVALLRRLLLELEGPAAPARASERDGWTG